MKHLVLAMAMLSATSAHAEFYDGNMLLTRMKGDALEQMAALGYVAGVWDAYMGVLICPPPNVSLNQARDLTRQMLEKMPEHRHQGADRFVIAAGATNFPCPKPGHPA